MRNAAIAAERQVGGRRYDIDGNGREDEEVEEEEDEEGHPTRVLIPPVAIDWMSAATRTSPFLFILSCFVSFRFLFLVSPFLFPLFYSNLLTLNIRGNDKIYSAHISLPRVKWKLLTIQR